MKLLLRTYLLFFLFLFIFQPGCGQNMKVLHFNMFSDKSEESQLSREIVRKKETAIRSLIGGIEADFYSFTENPKRKNQLERSVWENMLGSNFTFLQSQSLNCTHNLLFDTQKLNLLSKKNINTVYNPVFLYDFKYNWEQNNTVLHCFVIRTENAGNDIAVYLQIISNYIHDADLNGYFLIFGGTDNILINDARKLQNSKLSNYQSITFSDLSRPDLSTENSSLDLTPKFDFVITGKKSDNKDNLLEYLPDSYALVEEGASSFFFRVSEQMLDAVQDASAHTPVYFELESQSSKSTSQEKEKLIFDNFVMDRLYLEINWGKETMLTVQLSSIIGKSVYESTFNCPVGSYLMEIPMESFASGLYFLRVKSDEEEIIEKVQKIGAY